MRTMTIKVLLPTSLVVLSLLSVEAWAAAGKVTYAYGQAQAINTAGQSRSLAKDAEVQSGDTIQTQQGRAQVTFVDGGFVALQPNTTFKVSDYNYAGAEDGSEHSFFELLKGGMRFVTGAIGHKNKQNYKIKTVVATIGIRGSGGQATMCVNGSCPGQKDGLYLTGNQDVLTLTNGGDSKDVHPGESFFVGCSYCYIEPSGETPVVHVDIPAIKDFMAAEQCPGNDCVVGNLVLNSPVRAIGVVGNGDGIVTALNGGTLGNPPGFILLKGPFTGNSNIKAVAFNGEVADSFAFADGDLMFRWTNGTVTKFGPGGDIIGTEVLGPNSGDPFIIGSGPRDPLPGTGVAVYDFIAGTKSTQDSGALLGEGIIGGQVTVNFSGPAEVGVNFTVLHGQFYDVSGSNIPLNLSNGTFSGMASAYIGISSSCSPTVACPTEIAGSLEGHAVSSSGPITFSSFLGPGPANNAPEAVGLTYRIHDDLGGGARTPGPQNWIKGAGVFALCASRFCGG